MTSRSTWYAHQCIASSGLAIMDSQIAWQLRPDLWSGAQDCCITFQKKQSIEGARRLVATFPTYGEVQVYARSLDNIEKRLQWIVGEEPMALAGWQPNVPAVSPQLSAKREANRKEVELLDALRKLATEVPPGHDCSRRREILEARRELGMQ